MKQKKTKTPKKPEREVPKEASEQEETAVPPEESSGSNGILHLLVRHWLLVTLAMLLLIGAIIGVALSQNARPVPAAAASVFLDGISVSATEVVRWEKENLLLNTQGLLALLGEEPEWRYYSLPRGEFRFQDAHGGTAGMQEGSPEAQFYSSTENRLEKVTMACGPIVTKKDVFVPVAFAERWLGISVSYDAAPNTLSILRTGQPSPLKGEAITTDSEEDGDIDPIDSGREAASSAEASQPKDQAFFNSTKSNEEDSSSEATSEPSESSPEEADASSPEAEHEPTAQPEEFSIPADWIDCSYTAGGRTVSVYAVHRDGGYRFVNSTGDLLVGMVYGDIGSPSQTDRLTYRSPDGQAAGVIAGLRNTDGTMLYGVISFENGAQWIVPCYYDDLWEDEDGNFVGHIYGGGDGSVG